MKLDRFGLRRAVIAAVIVFCPVLASPKAASAKGPTFREGAPVKISFSAETGLENAWSVDAFDVTAPRSSLSGLNFVVTPFSDRIHAKIDLTRTVRKGVFSLTVRAEGDVEGTFDRQTGAITLPPIPLKWSERFFNMAWVMLRPSKFRNYEEVSPEEKKEFDELRRMMGTRAHDLPWTANLSGNLDWRGGGGMGRLEVNALFRGDWHVAASDHAYIVPPDRVFPGLGFIKTLEVFTDATAAKKAFGPGKAAWAIPNLGDEAKFRHGMRNEVLVRKGCWQVAFVNQNSKLQPGRPEPGPEFIERVEILDRYVQSLLEQHGESPLTPPAEPPSGQPLDSAVPPGSTQPIAGEPPSSTSPEPGGDVTNPPPPADDSTTGTDTTGISLDDSPSSILSPESAAGGAAILGGLGVIGAWLTMVSSGVRWKDVTDGAREWLSGTRQTPVEPPQVTLPPRGYDGQTNEQGEVWSDEDGGWIGRSLYEQENARRIWLDQKAQDDLHTGQSEDVKKVYDQWQQSQRELEATRQRFADELRQREIQWQREKIERLEQQSNRGVVVSEEVRDFVQGAVKDVKDLGAAAVDGKTWTSAWELGGDTLNAAGNTVAEIVGSPIQSTKKIVGFYGGVGEELLKWKDAAAKDHMQGLVQAGKFFSKTLVEPVYNGVHDLCDSHKPITDRIKVIAQVEVMVAMGGATQYASANLTRLAETGIHKVGGALGVDTSLLAGKPLTVPGDSKPFKSWGTSSREAFEETRKIFAEKTKMMENMNRVADDLLDPAKKQQAIADLVKLKKSDPAVFNLVKKELNSGTLKTVEDTSGALNREILSKTAQELEATGYKVKVKTAGNPGGADCDALWELRTKKGVLLNDKNTADLVEKSMGDVVKRDLGHLGATPEDLGHKVMNGSPERFAATPEKLGIPSYEGSLNAQGQVQFHEIAREGAHWANQKTPYLVRPGELISGDVMHREMAQSLGNVLNTKVEHLTALGAKATQADMLDAAREIFKTHVRTVTPMADRAGVAMTQEYQELIRNLRLTQTLERGAGTLPPVDQWERILQDQVSRIGDALPSIQ